MTITISATDARIYRTIDNFELLYRSVRIIKVNLFFVISIYYNIDGYIPELCYGYGESI